MPSSFFLGEFEQIVLLAVLRAGEEAWAHRLLEELRATTGRSVSRGAIYRTLDRLVDKDLVAWSLETADTPERGGHPRRRFTVTPGGIAALRDARAAVLGLSEGLEGALVSRFAVPCAWDRRGSKGPSVGASFRSPERSSRNRGSPGPHRVPGPFPQIAQNLALSPTQRRPPP